MEPGRKRKFYQQCFFNELAEEIINILDDSLPSSPIYFKEWIKIAVERKLVFWEVDVKPHDGFKEVK